jgi:hypothetical protein
MTKLRIDKEYLRSPSDFNYDLFGRQKVGNPYTLFDSAHRYQANDDFSDITLGNATVTYNANQSTSILNVSTSSGDLVSRESKRVFPYQPGKSLQVLQTFCFSESQENLRQRVGYFSRENGIFLELDGQNLYFVKRSYISGSIVDTKVPQSEWNTDRLDGDGPRGTILDISKAQILFSEYEWLGVGTVRVGFAINGEFIVCHEFHHSNLINSVYMTTASLPVRYEIETLGPISSTASMKQVCASVISNGGFERKTESWSAVRSTEETVGTDFYPIAAIRMKDGRTDSVIIPASINLLPTSADNFQWALVKNPTLTAGSWLTHSTNNVEYNISATAMTGGIIVRSGFLGASNQSTTAEEITGINDFDLQLGRTNADSPVSDIFVVGARVLSGSGSLVGSLGWFDLL